METGACDKDSILGSRLVITGNGGPKRLGGRNSPNTRMADGRDFWEGLPNLSRKLQPRNVIGVVGTGETAGAIALAILEVLEAKGLDRGSDKAQLMLISKQPSYYSRSDVVKDIKHFADPSYFSLKGVAERKAIIQRADRGVVSRHVKERLEESECVSYVIAEINWSDEIIPRSGPVKMKLKYAFEDEDLAETEQEFHCVVFALGFDDLWFLKLFEHGVCDDFLKPLFDKPPECIAKLRESVKKALSLKELPTDSKLSEYVSTRHHNVAAINSWITQRFQCEILPDLWVDGFSPKLFLPRLAGLQQGPGFPNLHCLGLLSDRIWASYLPTEI